MLAYVQKASAASDAFLLSTLHSLAGSPFGSKSNIGGAEGASYIAEALKVNTTLKELKCVAHVPNALAFDK